MAINGVVPRPQKIFIYQIDYQKIEKFNAKIKQNEKVARIGKSSRAMIAWPL